MQISKKCIFTKMHLTYLFILVLLCGKIIAQEKSYYQKIVEVQKKGTVNVDAKLLDGYWITMIDEPDTLHFTWHKNHLELATNININYKFYTFTNLHTTTILGTLFRWPPEHCIVNLIDSNKINVEFLNFRNIPKAKMYKKI